MGRLIAGMREESAPSRSREAKIARIAAHQHGVVSQAQLVAAGLSTSGIARWIKAARLHRIHRGVYAVGHARLTKHGRWLAAVLTCGDGAALSHRSAAALWGMRPQSSGPTEVSVLGRAGRGKRDGILLHRPRTLGAHEITTEDGIPVTTPARTIADLRRTVPEDHLHAAIRRAEILRLDIGPQPGYEADRSRSDLERLLCRICRRHHLPVPEQNVLIGDYEVDFLWREQGLIVEVDSWKYHGTNTAFENDRVRDVDLKLDGYTVLRVTDRRIEREPGWVAAKIRDALELSPTRT